MKIGIVGKGGVGKTTLCAALARAFARQGRRVMAVDADPNNCLGHALGLPDDVVAGITPICEMRELLCERAGTSQGGNFFAIDPDVDDLIERFSVRDDGVQLLVMGTIERAGSGCACPESSVLRALTRAVVVGAESVLLLDMEAGLEHLGRGTSRYMDALIIVVEPTDASVRTADRIAKLARELGVRTLLLVANKIRTAEDSAFVRGATSLPLVGELPFVPGLGWIGRAEPNEQYLTAVEAIKARLERELGAADASGPSATAPTPQES